MRSVLVLLVLALLWPDAALAAPDPPAAADLVARVREKGSKVKSFEGKVRLVRTDVRLLRDFFPPGPSGPPLNLDGLVAWSGSEGFRMFLHLGGVRYYGFQSRQGLDLRFEGLLRLGKGEASLGPDPGPPPPPDPHLGYEEFTLDTNTPRGLHPLLFVWPWELRPPLPDEQVLPKVGGESLFGQPSWQVELTGTGVRQKLWIDRDSSRVLRLVVDPAGEGEELQAQYRYDQASTWSEVEVSVGLRPLYVGRLSDPAMDPKESRIPEILVMRRPRGELTAPVPVRLPGAGLPAWQQGLLTALGLALAFLLFRLFWFRVSRQAYSRELILVEEEGGPWKLRFERLGFPVAAFTPEVMTEELQGLGKGATADTTRPPRAVVVAPEACEGIRKHTYLLKAYVEEGGRVLLLRHRKAEALPFPATMVDIPESAMQAVRTDPAGPWRRASFEDVGRFAAATGCGTYYASLDGGWVDRELVVMESAGAARKGVAVGILRRGQGEWIVCQLELSAASVAHRTVGERVFLDLMDFLLGQRAQAAEE